MTVCVPRPPSPHHQNTLPPPPPPYSSRSRAWSKQLLAETNPIVLVITMIVSLLHSIFNFLAFKNDISFWKDKKRCARLKVDMYTSKH